MGKAILKGLQETSYFSDIYCIDPKGEDAFTDEVFTPEHIFTDLQDAPPSDILLLAVKPQILHKIKDDIQSYLEPETAIWSIAAGVSIPKFETYFGSLRQICRIMPNMPASIGKGVFAGCHNGLPTEASTLVETCLKEIGHFVWVKDDTQIDIVTALSGGAPAYYYLFSDIMARAAHELGMDLDTAQTLIRETMVGSGAVLENDKDKSFEDLITQVASPGGTTREALNIFNNGDFEKNVTDALTAAFRRGQELSED